MKWRNRWRAWRARRSLGLPKGTEVLRIDLAYTTALLDNAMDPDAVIDVAKHEAAEAAEAVLRQRMHYVSSEA